MAIEIMRQVPRALAIGGCTTIFLFSLNMIFGG